VTSVVFVQVAFKSCCPRKEGAVSLQAAGSGFQAALCDARCCFTQDKGQNKQT